MIDPNFTSYMDETGHAADDAQRFCGMAGFITTDDKWQTLQERWDETLNKFNVKYMHMKEFVPSWGIFKGWKGEDAKKDRFLKELMRHLRDIRAIPFGSIYSLDAYRKLSEEEKQILNTPYLKSLVDCVGIPAFLLQDWPKEIKYNVVFSDQKEFKHRAKRIVNLFRAGYTIGEQMEEPEFKDMKDSAPLQAADIVAYELHREFARQLYNPSERTRYGYVQLLRLANRTLPFMPFFFYSEQHIRSFIAAMRSEFAARGVSTAEIDKSWRQFYSRQDVPEISDQGRKMV